MKKLAGRETQLKNQEKNIKDLKQEKDGLTMRTMEVNNESIKVSIQSQNKITKLTTEIQTYKKKVKKLKTDSQISEKTQATKIAIKDKTINDLL